MRLFSSVPLKELGHSITITGVVYSDSDLDYVIKFPDESWESEPLCVEATPEEWQQILKQTDSMEVEVLAQAKDGTLTKAVLRKCERQISQQVSWEVFKRDNYSCRYCGNSSTPLTVDHLVLWEKGGPSTKENLVAACRPCNKARGNMEYHDWLTSDKYAKASQKLQLGARLSNEMLLPTLKDVKVKLHVASR